MAPLLLALQIFHVAFLALHDFVPLGALNDPKAARTADPLGRLVLVTALSTAPFALGLGLSVGFGGPDGAGGPYPLALRIYLAVIYAGLLAGQIRAWWVPYLGRAEPDRAARYAVLFGKTHSFLPARNGIRPNTLHVGLHLATVGVLVELDRRHQWERVISAQIAANETTVLEFERQAAAISLPSGADLEVIQARSREIHSELETAQRDLRILETLRLNDDFARATQAELSSRLRLQRGQERFGRARRVETTAAALHDAARRAAAETLDLRLERVLPLMAELYARLKPHPIWQDIEYSIRGDVRRFLSLKVGDDLNPQFMFSSGQRRATGLAFLLSINLSLAWSRWRSVLLDDPVQHVDDFRAVHLTEVLSQLVESGRQVICAVEDPALADMMCRRLPIRETGQCCRITLAPTASGTLQVKSATLLKPLPQRAFGAIPHELAG